MSERPSTRRQTGAFRSPWYADGLRFDCTRCGECCRGAPGYVWVNDREVTRIARFLGMDEGELRRQSVRRVGPRLSLKEREDGDCVFYQGGCLIYPVRPTQCAIFPFWESNLRRPHTWELLTAECPGIGRGSLWTRQEIEMSLRADRASVGGQELLMPELTESVLRALGDVYRRLDRELAARPGPCDRCGTCCRFKGEAPTLCVSHAEAALVLRWVGRSPAEVGSECPFLEEDLCSVYPVRPLGCRTYFCRDDQRQQHQALYERALDELKSICRQGVVGWRYGPLLELLRERARGQL